MKRAVWLIGLFWAIGISVYIMFAPLVRSVRVSQTFTRDHSDIQTAPVYSMASWYETRGLVAARPLVIPIVLSFLPLIAATGKARRIVGSVSVVLLAAFCVLTAFSVGIYYSPGIIALTAAMVADFLGGKKAGGNVLRN